MGWYALSLAASQVLTPVLCGFIAQYKTLNWVYYCATIFLGACFLFLFFFMEETNYNRKSFDIVENSIQSTLSTDCSKEGFKISDTQITHAVDTSVPCKEKSFVKKLALLGVKKEQFTILRRIEQTFYFFSWPIIVYAGYVFVIGFVAFPI